MMYADHALSPSLFHWESQNAAAEASTSGQRFIHHSSRGQNIVLLTRQTKNDELGTAPHLCLGAVDYVSHQGERPMAITWRLQRSMPAKVARAASIVTACGVTA